MLELFDHLEKLVKDGSTYACAELDANGFMIRSDDDDRTYLARVKRTLSTQRRVFEKLQKSGKTVIFEDLEVTEDERITAELLDTAGEVTEELYSFRVRWVPGFYLRKGVGMFWGGCAITDPDECLTSLFLRGNFSEKEKWFVYSRRELMAHELCHTARMVLTDDLYEEHFAYQTSESSLRRYLGNCFRTRYDAFVFALPSMILAMASAVRVMLPYNYKYTLVPFWVLACAGPLWLLLRNQRERIRFGRAERALKKIGCSNPSAILFRCDAAEIEELTLFASTTRDLRAHLRKKAADSLKWQIINQRFLESHTDNPAEQ